MVRKKNTSRIPAKPATRPPAAWKGKAARVAAVVVLAAAGGVGLGLLRKNLLGSAPYAGKIARVRLANWPEDLPRDIPARVLEAVQSHVAGRNVFDDRLARDVYEKALADPWVAKVRRVRKTHDGAVVVEAVFRRPFALVAAEHAPGEFQVIDAEGVVLPLRADRVRPGAFISIDGVGSPPPEPGGKWDSPDLAAGLRLYRLVKGRAYEKQITTIDVRDPNALKMYAQVGRGRRTDVRFGRFPAADGLDYCLSPTQKLTQLDEYVRKNGGKLAGTKEWVDLRYDEVHVSLN